ncbi:SPOR domain-containing protein [Guyparkeria hydrothermalis]|uniref:SPOR domain-containing protein n=1 Tax=Guyparkeria hydrothermalis TaxID=923 RepID=UPI002020BC93|nr:SPOR domain-containing protein [Guyparkeria hydrothermalis]MCL7744784.1 SPOR domain-containing protein [Guyparkeria hydrothermalis]
MSNRGRKKVNRPRSGDNRGAKWTLLIAVVLLVGLVVVLARLTAEKNSQPEAENTGQTDTRSVEKAPEKKAVSPESEFQFYTLLPEKGSQSAPNKPPAEDEEAPTPPDEKKLDSETGYLIQAGSFRAAKDADARKAALALLGMESRVAAVTVAGQRYHRVIVGPVPGDQVSAVRSQLEEAGIESAPPRRAPG